MKSEADSRQPNISRRQALKGIGLISLILLFPELACSPAITPATAPATAAAKIKPEDYFKRENTNIREQLVSEMADLFIEKTDYHVPNAKGKLTDKWTWGFSLQDKTNYIAANPDATPPKTFNAFTHFPETGKPKTFMDMDKIIGFKGPYTPEEKFTILKAIILHEMQQRTIGSKDHVPPINMIDPVTDQVLFKVKSNLGFVLQTDDNRHTGVDLNEAGAEAGAVISLGSDYISGTSYDRGAPVNYENLGKLLQPLKITWQEVIEFQRKGDALGFGAAVAEKLGYKSIQKNKTSIVGLTLASLAAEGRIDDFKTLLARLKITWPPGQPLDLNRPENPTSSADQIDVFSVMEYHFNRQFIETYQLKSGFRATGSPIGESLSPVTAGTLYQRPRAIQSLPLAV